MLAADYISPKGSKSIFLSLGLHHAKIDQFEKDNLILHGSREVIYKTLLSWKNGSDGTIRELVTALDQTGNIECLKQLIRQFREDGTLDEISMNQFGIFAFSSRKKQQQLINSKMVQIL